MDHYDVNQGKDVIGKVTVAKEGLYYVISCKCHLGGDVMYDLVMRSNGSSKVLGLLAPDGGMYSLRRKIPFKEAGEGTLTFYVKPRHQKMEGLLVPVCEGAPFAYLSQLEQAFLIRSGRGMMLRLPQENNAKKHEINA